MYIAVAAGALLLVVILYFCCKPSSKTSNGVIDFTQVLDVYLFVAQLQRVHSYEIRLPRNFIVVGLASLNGL